MSRKRTFAFTLSTLLSALCVSVGAQQPKKIPRIGFLAAGPLSTSARTDAFRQRLRDLGYIEGQNRRGIPPNVLARADRVSR
ncbi:MAG TPA: hypothetical protein VLX11_13275 [Candidatus Acidoferrales bacterium]|nr:hypothetical protein [Candidatus Acidoferrales bacterium]